MLTYILRAESQRFQFVCVADCSLREREFSVLFLCLFLSVCPSIHCHLNIHAKTLPLRPKAYRGYYGYSSYHWVCVTNRCKHWKKNSFFLSFWESCRILNSTAFFLFFFFLLAGHVMLHKNPDLLLTQGSFFFCEWGNGNKKLIWAS